MTISAQAKNKKKVDSKIIFNSRPLDTDLRLHSPRGVLGLTFELPIRPRKVVGWEGGPCVIWGSVLTIF